jgi:endoglucanase
MIGCADESPSQPAAPIEGGATTDAIRAKTPTQFFVPPADPAAVKQIVDLAKGRDVGDALKLAALEATPRAVWFTSGTPEDVQKAVRQTMTAAALENRIPVLVAYDIPFRDCAGYSAGGATDTAAYAAWIDSFAQGIGNGKADVILEPDSLGIIPYNTTISGAAEWCQPTITDATGATVAAPGASTDERYAQLQGAIATLAAKAPNAAIYIDGTHSAWLGVGEAAFRIHKAGFDPSTGTPRVKGFFLNASNYQITGNLAQYGTWISECLAYATSVTPGDFGSCPNQYWNGGPLPSLIAQLFGEWNGVALDPNGQWSDTSTTQSLNTSAINLRYANMLNGAAATLPFVIDTSRNANGPLDTAPYAAAPFNQPASVIAALNGGSWCNPPGAGAGLRPTARTGVPLLDAYLWIKTPGESDGACAIAGGARAWDYAAYNPWNVAGDAQASFDPLWGMVDPAAGAWFPAQALELARLAVPPLF